MAAVIGALRAELSASIAKFASDMGKAGDEVGKFSKRFNRIGGGIKSVGTKMSTWISVPVLGAGAAILKTAGDFEAGMNRVEAATGATADQMARMGDLAKQLGQDTSFSATEAADAMEILAKNGLDAEQILGGAADAAVKLAAASGSEMAAAGDVATDVMLNFNKKADELGGVVDSVTGVLLQSKFGFDDYRLAIGQAGGVAGKVGVTLEDFNAVIAATSESFAGGSDAGTSFKNFLTRLTPSSSNAAKAMENLGLQFFNADGSMRTMAEVAEELRTKMGGLSDEDLSHAMKTIFGVDAMRTAIGLMEEGGAGIEAMRGKIAQASAEEQAAARMKGLTGTLEQLRGSLETLAIKIAESGLLQFITDLATQVVDFISRLSESNPTLLKWGTVIAGVAMLLGPAIAAVGALVMAVATVAPALAALGPAMALLTGPVGILVGAVAGLIAIWVAFGDEIKLGAAVAFQFLDEALGGRLSAAVEGAKALFQGWLDHIRLTFQLLGQLITGDFSGSLETLRQIWANVWSTLASAVEAVVPGVTAAVASIYQGVKAWLQDRLGAVLDWVAGKVGAVTSVFRNMYTAVVGESYVPDMVDGIAREFGRLGSVMVSPAEDAAGSVGAAFERAGSKVGQTFGQMVRDGEFSLGRLGALATDLMQSFINSQSAAAGGGGGFLNELAGGFVAGFRADGGPVVSGRSYIVGEDGPEVFRPSSSGEVLPNAMGREGVMVNIVVNTPDADSFRRSQSQIYARAQSAMTRATARNR